MKHTSRRFKWRHGMTWRAVAYATSGVEQADPLRRCPWQASRQTDRTWPQHSQPGGEHACMHSRMRVRARYQCTTCFRLKRKTAGVIRRDDGPMTAALVAGQSTHCEERERESTHSRRHRPGVRCCADGRGMMIRMVFKGSRAEDSAGCSGWPAASRPKYYHR